MHFGTPQALWLLWLLPPLALLSWLAASRRKAALRRFADEALLAHLVPPPSAARAALRALLLGGAVTLCVLAAAGPRWGFQWEEVKRRGVDVVVALDLSRSMLAEDIKPNRLTASKREIRDLLELLQGDRVGLVAFAGEAFVQVPLTLDYGAFSVFLDELDPDWVPVGGTDLGQAVRTGTEAFLDTDRAGRALLLITDGEDHGGELRAAAEEAKKEGVHVFVVGIGAPEGAPIPDGRGGFVKQGGKVVLTKLDEPALKELAVSTGGTYVRSTAGDLDLRKIYLEDIKGTLESRDLSSSRQRRWEERFQWALLPALLLLLLESLVGPPRRRTETIAEEGARTEAARRAAAVLLLGLLLPLAAPASAQAGWFRSDDPARLGQRAFADGQFQDALNHWTAAQTADPADRRLDYNIGTAQYRLQNWAEAEQAFRAAASTDDTALAADALYNAGNAAFQQGKYQDAIAAYDAALELRPEDEDAVANRDLAQRRYEELLEQAKNQQEQQQDPQEQQEPQDGQADQQEQQPSGQDGDGEGEQQEKQKEQQQGQGMSEQDAQAEQSEEGEQQPEQREPDEAESEREGADDGSTSQQPEQAEAAAAEAADIDRAGEAGEEGEETPSPDGALAADEDAGEGGPEEQPFEPVEGALSPEQAEALLNALKADQSRRRQERTERAARQGRRAAGKDW